MQTTIDSRTITASREGWASVSSWLDLRVGAAFPATCTQITQAYQAAVTAGEQTVSLDLTSDQIDLLRRTCTSAIEFYEEFELAYNRDMTETIARYREVMAALEA